MKILIRLVMATLFAANLACSSSNPGDIIRNYGYSELRPPSTLLPPGTIVSLRRVDPVEADLVCTQAQSLGQLAQSDVQQSTSATSEVAQRLTGSFRISASYLEQIQARAQFTAVKSIELAFTNVHVLAISDTTVLQALPRRDASCTTAINLRLQRHEPVTMITDVIQANVQYNVRLETSASLSVEAQGEVMRALAASLGADLSTVSTTGFSGSGLFWGVRDDANLVDPTQSGTVRSTSAPVAAATGPARAILPSALLRAINPQ